MRNVRVSVIMSVYNVQDYLGQALASLAAQTFPRFEVICVDDGSTDASACILENFAERDSRFQVIRQENQGISVARNVGLKMARGEYIYFMDGDDVIHPRLLEIALHFAGRYSADMVSFSFKPILPDETAVFQSYRDINDIAYKIPRRPLKHIGKDCSWKILGTVWSKLYRRSILEDKYFLEGICFEDYPMVMRILYDAPKTVILREKLYFYRRNPASVSNAAMTPKQLQDYHTGLNDVFALYSQNPALLSEAIQYLFSNILKQQYNKIRRSSLEAQAALFEVFAAELDDLDQKKCIRLSGNKFGKWLAYRRLIGKYRKTLSSANACASNTP